VGEAAANKEKGVQEVSKVYPVIICNMGLNRIGYLTCLLPGEGGRERQRSREAIAAIDHSPWSGAYHDTGANAFRDIPCMLCVD
jgi:hypothetical protein